jgi:uncharacterized membrane protein
MTSSKITSTNTVPVGAASRFSLKHLYWRRQAIASGDFWIRTLPEFLPRVRIGHEEVINVDQSRDLQSCFLLKLLSLPVRFIRWAVSFAPGGIPQLAVWFAAFAASHIGMSAVRNTIIDQFGAAAASVGLVVANEDPIINGTTAPTTTTIARLQALSQIQIPFPDAATAGRQLYRAFYTAISFTTLGSALVAYLHHSSSIHSDESIKSQNAVFFWVAVAANTAALASLANASPLGLMPAFTASDDDDDTIVRDDKLKFQVRGLTRISRHPLILPVVPWGICNAVLAGNSVSDWILFGGLAVYAVAGCAAQDLRVSRHEGSVGTVFSATDDDDNQLEAFFDSTSFVPFGAVIDGRQSLHDIVQEVPWVAVVLAVPVAYAIETAMIKWLASV